MFLCYHMVYHIKSSHMTHDMLILDEPSLLPFSSQTIPKYKMEEAQQLSRQPTSKDVIYGYGQHNRDANKAMKRKYTEDMNSTQLSRSGNPNFITNYAGKLVEEYHGNETHFFKLEKGKEVAELMDKKSAVIKVARSVRDYLDEPKKKKAKKAKAKAKATSTSPTNVLDAEGILSAAASLVTHGDGLSWNENE